jgi:hypothetical protein
MGNTTLITDWFNKTPDIPFDFIRPVLDSEGAPVIPPETESASAIVIVVPWVEAIETLTTQQENQIIDLAFDGFMKYYYPTRWYIINNSDRYLENNPMMNADTHLPRWYSAPPASWAPGLNSTLRNVLTGGGSLGERPLVIEDWKMPSRPGSRLHVLVIIDKNKFEARSSVGAVTDSGIPPAEAPYSSIWTDWPQITNDETILRNLERCPGDTGFAESLRRVREAVPTWASDRCIPIQRHEEPARPLAKSDIPFFPEVITFWNEQQNIIPWDDPASSGRVLTFTWSEVNKQLQTIKTLFTKYHNQARRFDGQIVPGINFEAQFRSLEDLTGRISELLKLNDYVVPSKAEDEVTVYVNANYQITGIEYFQPSESLNMQPVKKGYLSYSVIEPFMDFQTVIYLTQWNEMIRLISNPPGRQYEPFINFIEDYANSHLRTYEINYCGPAHSPPARDEIEAANDMLVFGSGPVGQLIKDSGYMSSNDDVLHLSSPFVGLQNKMLKDPTNRGLILNDQFAKTEEKAEDVMKTVMSKLREIKNSEEMTIIKHVLHKVGIDRLIIEAIKCLTLNTNFNPTGLVSDIKDLVSTGSELFAGRKRPMSFEFPEITVDVPVFSITGDLQGAIKNIILEALLGAAAAIVEALIEMIREACKPSDDDDKHGALNLANMFDQYPSPNKKDLAAPLLGQPHGLNVCFSTYNIPDAVGMKYIRDVSMILTPREICQLLRGTPTDEAVEAVLEYNLLYEEPPIPDNLNVSSAIISFFGCLGDMVDIDAICRIVVEEMTPAVDDLCITEEQVLSAVDTFNLNNLLDMLENGVVIDVPEINLTCPTKPDYTPNPLVDRSIPQLMKAMAEVLGVTFYLSVDGIKTVLLNPTTKGSELGACIANAAGKSEDMAEGDAKIDTKIMEDIADALTKLAGAMDGGITKINEEMAPCGMEITDVFGGMDDLAPVIDVVAEIFRNLDFSGASALGDELKTIADNPEILPVISREFPSNFKDAIKNLVPSLDGRTDGYRSYELFPYFHLQMGSRGRIEMRTENGNAIGFKYRRQDPQYPRYPDYMEYRFIENSGIANLEVTTGSNGEVISTSTTWGHELNKITYPSLQNIESKPIDKKLIYDNDLSGPRILTGSYNFQSKLYNADELSDNLGSLVLADVENHDEDGPAQAAFASTVANSLKGFLGSIFEGDPEVDEQLYKDYFKHLKDSYYHSTMAGVTKGFTNHILRHGRFTTNSISEMLLRPDNSKCDPNDPSKVGDLMDMNGIIKDVQDEYNEAVCNDEMSLEDTVNKCILFGTMLLFLQISITKFYLQNISILSAFKLDEIMGLTLVRDFITTRTFEYVDKFMNPVSISPQMAQALSNTMGVFSDLFVQEANDWMSRKIARGTALNREVLIALEIDPDQAATDSTYAENELLNNNNAIKYMIAWRLQRSALPISNVISNPGALSVEDALIKNVIGFDSPFSSEKLIEGVTTFSPPALSPSMSDFRLYVNDRVTNVENLFGYGGFKIEPWLYWERPSDKDGIPLESSIEIDFGVDLPTDVAGQSYFTSAGAPSKKLTLSHIHGGKAPIEAILAAEQLVGGGDPGVSGDTGISLVVQGQTEFVPAPCVEGADWTDLPSYWVHEDLPGWLLDRVDGDLVGTQLPGWLLDRIDETWVDVTGDGVPDLPPGCVDSSGNPLPEVLDENGNLTLGSWQDVEDAPKAWTTTSDIILNHARVKYRLVYYPPLESSLADGHVSVGDPNYTPTTHKFNTLQALLRKQVQGQIDHLVAKQASTSAPTDLDIGEYENQVWEGLLAESINNDEAFIPLSLSRTESEVVGAEEGIGTPWAPLWTELDTDYAQEHWFYVNGCDRVARGELTAANWVNEDGQVCADSMWVSDVACFDLAEIPDQRIGACVEQFPPETEPFDPDQPDVDMVWSWLPDSKCRDLLSRDEWKSQIHPDAIGNRHEIDYTVHGGDDDGEQRTWTTDRYNVCGEWEMLPLADFLSTEVTLAQESEYITTAIPIMELDGQHLGDLGFANWASVGAAGHITGKESDLSLALPPRMDIKNSPDYSKFEYFFSKIINKDAPFLAVLMNNFCQTEDKFSTKMNEQFSDTLMGAAGLFMTTLEIGARESGIAPDRVVGLPGIQDGGGPPYINVNSFILKALREMPLHILKGLCEMFDPHVIITKIIKDISGQVINQSIDAMEMGISIAEETSPEPIQSILKALEVNPEAFVKFAFCQLNQAMRPHSNMPSECRGGSDTPDPFSEMSPFPTFTLKGVNFTGTIPGIFMMPPGPFGIVYLILRFLLEAISMDPPNERAPDNSSC